MRRRTMSQNLLRDGAAIRTFLDALPPRDGLPCVEVGAGDGALTRPLAHHFGAVTAWELDPAMARRLSVAVQDIEGVEIKTGDFVTSSPPEHPFHLAGNVPFGITTRITRWALATPALASATMITQLEYARKHTGDYGRWPLTTVRSWPDVDWSLAGRIPRTSFRPVPAVDAGVLRIQRRQQRLIPDSMSARWDQVVTLGFEGVGGSLFASLRALYSRRQLIAAFRAASVEQAVVVAFVHPDQWLVIFRHLEGMASPRAGLS
jgi:23S rRNA (adenine-N6)-dimethyltransferase